MSKDTLLFYPTVFSVETSDASKAINVRVPDVGAITFGKDMQEAIIMARNVVYLLLEGVTNYPDTSDVTDIELEEWENPETTKVVLVS
ncbi:MAG: hypothetical protein LBT37_06440 [Lactobacillaceae bacterium]|jgi:hypothetical protein|nr:hypothetical protein [Lactobacillaceae bacterium]